MQNSNLKAFTLVELIVVITILAILGTIAFISLQGYSSTARNSKRVSDIVNVGKGLEIKKIKSGFYEFPENYETFTGTLTKTLKQGILGDKVLTNIGVTTNVKDPITEDNYTYSVYGEGEYYQIAYELENNIFSSNLNILNTINAEDTTKAVKIKGNYEMDPSLPSLIVIPETVTGSGIFDPEVCFILEGGENNFKSTSIDCQKKKEMSLKDFDEGLVGYWDMETLTGTLLKDLSGNGNNGNGSGGVVIGGIGGLFGKGIYFDGINDYIEILDSQTLHFDKELTISFSLNVNNWSSSYTTILQKSPYLGWCSNSNSGSLSIFNHYNNGYIAGSLCHDGTNNYTSNKINPRPNNYGNFNFYTFKYDGIKFNSYLNGKLMIETDSHYGNIKNSTFPFWIAKNNLYYLNAIIDDLKIYNRPLSETEIKQQAKIAGF